MGIMTNFSVQQAPAKMEIWGCYPRVACAFQLADSESIHIVTLCSLFFPGSGRLAYWKASVTTVLNSPLFRPTPQTT